VLVAAEIAKAATTPNKEDRLHVVAVSELCIQLPQEELHNCFPHIH
jgi:hypothetical protein